MSVGGGKLSDFFPYCQTPCLPTCAKLRVVSLWCGWPLLIKLMSCAGAIGRNLLSIRTLRAGVRSADILIIAASQSLHPRHFYQGFTSGQSGRINDGISPDKECKFMHWTKGGSQPSFFFFFFPLASTIHFSCLGSERSLGPAFENLPSTLKPSFEPGIVV